MRTDGTALACKDTVVKDRLLLWVIAHTVLSFNASKKTAPLLHFIQRKRLQEKDHQSYVCRSRAGKLTRFLGL